MRFLPIVWIIPILLVGTIDGGNANAARTTCEVSIGSKRLFKPWPLVFKADGELYPTSANNDNEVTVTLKDGSDALLSCGPNYLRNYGRKETLRVRCNAADGTFAVIEGTDNTAKDIKEFTCDLRVIEEVLSPVDGCSNEKWTASSFGYIDPIEQQTYILGEACYDMTDGCTIFAHVRMGDKSGNLLRKIEDKTFLSKGQHPNSRYKIELFRGLHFDEIYERIRSQLHIKNVPQMKMTNYVDEILLSSAQYQAVKKLGWNYYVTHDELTVLEALKQDIKKLSSHLNLDVYVGGHGVSVLRGNNGEKLELYLQPETHNRFPVPELIWILVKHQQKVTAFAVYNDAANTIEEAMHTTNICSSACNTVTWLLETKKPNIDQKPLVCCSYKEFKSAIKTAPQWEDVKEMLL